jgi:sarcosine oxidase subunit delta
MLYIPCPWCGERPHYEFSYEGDATVDPATELYFRANPAGPHDELWYHRDGCRQWLRVTRDTVTQTIHAAVPAGKAPST